MEKENKFRNGIVRYAGLFTVIVLFVTFGIVFLRDCISNRYATTIVQSAIIYGTFDLLFTLLISVPIILKAGYQNRIGMFRVKGMGVGLLLGVVDLFLGLVYIGISFYGFNHALIQFQGVGVMAAMLFFMLATGVVEEFVDRGILLQVFMDKWKNSRNGMVYSVFASSFVFGLQHIFALVVTYLFTGEITSDLILNKALHVVFTFIAGIYYATIMIYAKNIWSVAIVHGLYDFVVGLSLVFMSSSTAEIFSIRPGLVKIFGDHSILRQSYTEPLWFVLTSLPEFILAVVLLRRYGKEI